MSEKTKGIIFMLISSASFSMMQLVVKLSSTNIGTIQQAFFRNLISLVVAGVIIHKRGISYFGPKKYQPALFTRSMAGFIGIFFLFYASSHASQGDVAVLSRTSPIWVSLFAWLILKEKIPKVQVPVIALCLLGAVVAMRPTFDSSMIPLAMAGLTAVGAGIAYTMIALCKGHVDPMTVIFHFSFISSVGSGLLMIPGYVSPTAKEWLMLVLIGVFGAMGQIFLTYSFQKAPASEVSVYDYSGILFSALLGLLVLGERLTANTVIGGALIIASGLWSYFSGRKSVPAAESEGTT